MDMVWMRWEEGRGQGRLALVVISSGCQRPGGAAAAEHSMLLNGAKSVARTMVSIKHYIVVSTMMD